MIVGPTRERLELAERVRELRAQHLTHREVARRLDITRSYASTLADDPDGSKARARKDSYRGVCVDCEGPTSGSEGRSRTPERCEVCAIEKRHAEKRWTRETVIDAIQRFADENGRPPRATEWNNADPERGYPAKTSVYESAGWNPGAPFEKWADAIEAAGFPRPEIGHREGQRWWTRDLVLAELRRQSTDGVAPSSGSDTSLQFYATRFFGSWPNACKAAGVSARMHRAYRFTTSEALVEWLTVNAEHGLAPRVHLAQSSGAYKAAQRLHGSWSAAVDAAGLTVVLQGQRRDWLTRAAA